MQARRRIASRFTRQTFLQFVQSTHAALAVNRRPQCRLSGLEGTHPRFGAESEPNGTTRAGSVSTQNARQSAASLCMSRWRGVCVRAWQGQTPIFERVITINTLSYPRMRRSQCCMSVFFGSFALVLGLVVTESRQRLHVTRSSLCYLCPAAKGKRR